MSNYTEVKLWMAQAGQFTPSSPRSVLTPHDFVLRKRLIDEETAELYQAMDECDIVEIADGIADLLVVTYGTAASYGMNADAIFTEVMRSNWTKLGPKGFIRDAGGKVIKPDTYKQPDIARVLREGQ